jgi:hypothetical protein
MISIMLSNRYLPDDRETALLLAALAEEKADRQGTEVKNLRLSKATLQKISNRLMLPPEFLRGVQQWLLHCGWVLFEAGPVFGLVRVKTVDNWPRCSSQRIKKTLQEVKAGEFDFSKLEDFLKMPKAEGRDSKIEPEGDDE